MVKQSSNYTLIIINNYKTIIYQGLQYVLCMAVTETKKIQLWKTYRCGMVIFSNNILYTMYFFHSFRVVSGPGLVQFRNLV
jgi:hypothetical protein